jgi:hypothetical protein
MRFPKDRIPLTTENVFDAVLLGAIFIATTL